MPSATSPTNPLSSRHSSRGPLPTVTPTSPATDRNAQSRPAADTRLPDVHKPAHRPPRRWHSRASSKPLPTDRSKSLSINQPLRKCGAHTARGSSPSAACRPCLRCLPYSFRMLRHLLLAPSSPSHSRGALAQLTGTVVQHRHGHGQADAAFAVAV
jgi:hypothetical protein